MKPPSARWTNVYRQPEPVWFRQAQVAVNIWTLALERFELSRPRWRFPNHIHTARQPLCDSVIRLWSGEIAFCRGETALCDLLRRFVISVLSAIPKQNHHFVILWFVCDLVKGNLWRFGWGETTICDLSPVWPFKILIREDHKITNPTSARGLSSIVPGPLGLTGEGIVCVTSWCLYNLWVGLTGSCVIPFTSCCIHIVSILSGNFRNGQIWIYIYI